MLSFSGMDPCSLDANGRLKLSPRVIENFNSRGLDLVLHCLPEGAVAVYPEEVYLAMRRNESNSDANTGDSMLFRRKLRRFGAWSQSERISPQGRITLPPLYREYAGLDKQSEAVVVGVEIGVEIWSVERWAEEEKLLREHAREKGRLEMQSELNNMLLK